MQSELRKREKSAKLFTVLRNFLGHMPIIYLIGSWYGTLPDSMEPYVLNRTC